MSRRTALPAWCRVVRERPATWERETFQRVLAERDRCQGPRDVSALLTPRFEREEVEVFIAIALDAQQRVIALTEVSRGIADSTLVHPREVFRVAVAVGAASLILAHNHPSGDPTPSLDDRAVTAQMVDAGRILDILVHDHVVFGAGRFVSFAEAGLL